MQAGNKASWGKEALICFALSALLILLCSMSSPLYPLNIWDDANCLLTVGRVMKSGGVLYRDIYEQKGPLLYGIHMLAACISETSFLGVYWLETLSFAALLLFVRRMLRLWASERAAWASVLLFGAFAATSRAFARGDSAEEFCLPLLAAALCAVCSHAKQEQGPMTLRGMFALGVLAGAVATIKYTVLGLFIGLCIAQGIPLLIRGRFGQLLVSAGVFLAGMMLPILPWLGYFACHGALGDAYTAYIHNNVFLYSAAERSLGTLAETIARAGVQNVFWAAPAAASVLLISMDREKSGFMRLSVVLSAICAAAAVFLPGEVHPYYPLVLSVFAPFALAYGFNAVEKALPAKQLLLPVTAAAAAVIAVLLSPNAFLRGVSLSDTAQGRLAAQMEPGATLLQYSHLDDGLYLTSGALPQEKYFVLLNVDYPEMREALDAAVREGRPDYVLVSWRELPEEFDRYTLWAADVGYDDEGRLNKALYLYRRKDEGA